MERKIGKTGIMIAVLLMSMALMVNLPTVKASGTIYIRADGPTDSSLTEVIDWWPMFHHDLNHTGYSTSTAPNTNNTIWSYTTSDYVTSSPAIADDKVYVGSDDKKVYCLDAATGTFIWSYTTGESVTSSPAIADDRVYVGSWDKKVYAFGPPQLIHDVAIANITPSKTVVGQGYNMNVNVTVANQGDYTETFDVTLYADSGTPMNESGLVGYWNFDEGTGTIAHDSSGNNNDGTIYGATWTSGKYGQALSFDGVDDYVEMAENTDLDPHTSNWTISAWVNVARLTGPYVFGNDWEYGFVIVGKRQTEFGDYSLTLLAHGGTSETSPAKFAFVLDGPSQAAGAESDLINVFGWHHVVGVRRSGELYVYVDGVEYGPNNFFQDGSHITPTTDVNSNTPIHLGHHGAWNQYYNGIIDEVKIYNRALSAEEVWAEYTGQTKFIIGTQTVTLESGASKFLIFPWNTTGLAKGNYTISAYAEPVPNETDTADNTFINGIITVTIPGDLDGDFEVRLVDLVILAQAYSSKPGEPKWNPNADIDDNKVVGLTDLVILAKNYGKTDP